MNTSRGENQGTRADLRCHSSASAVSRLGVQRALGLGEIEEIGAVPFTACVPAIPYAPSAAFIARERAKIQSREGERPRVAIVADGIGAMHGVTRTIEEIRERGVDGFEIEGIGTDRNVDRRLAAVADVEIPHYPGMEIGVPTLPAAVETIADGRYDLIHVCARGRAASPRRCSRARWRSR